MTCDDVAVLVFLWIIPAVVFCWCFRMLWQAVHMYFDIDYEPPQRAFGSFIAGFKRGWHRARK